MGRIESATAEELVSELNEMDKEVSLEELEYTKIYNYNRQFNLEFEPENQPEEARNSSFYAAARGTADEMETEMNFIKENVDAVLDDYVTADLGIYTGGADNRREHIRLYKLDFEDEEEMPDSDGFVDYLQFVYDDGSVANSSWEEHIR